MLFFLLLLTPMVCPFMCLVRLHWILICRNTPGLTWNFLQRGFAKQWGLICPTTIAPISEGLGSEANCSRLCGPHSQASPAWPCTFPLWFLPAEALPLPTQGCGDHLLQRAWVSSYLFAFGDTMIPKLVPCLGSSCFRGGSCS